MFFMFSMGKKFNIRQLQIQISGLLIEHVMKLKKSLTENVTSLFLKAIM